MTFIECLEYLEADSTPNDAAADANQAEPTQVGQTESSPMADSGNQADAGFDADGDFNVGNPDSMSINVGNGYSLNSVESANGDDSNSQTPMPAFPSRIYTHVSKPAPTHTRPAATLTPKRKREHPSELEPTNWLPSLHPPNLALAKSIDHSTTNPSNDVRVATPYPTPPDILQASQAMIVTNINNYYNKLASGTLEKNNRIPWTVYEDDLIIRTMLEIRTDTSVPQTEKRFEECSKRIDWNQLGLCPRSGQAIKNMWCRVGRARSGFDERKGFNQKTEHARNGWKGKPGNTRADKEARKAKKVRVE